MSGYQNDPSSLSEGLIQMLLAFQVYLRLEKATDLTEMHIGYEEFLIVMGDDAFESPADGQI